MKNRIRVALDTLGCKLNQAESELLMRRLASAGFELVSPDETADVYILNTCTVTHIADRKARQSLRAFKRRNPEALLIATGCYAERARQELAGIPGVSYVLGNEEKARIVELLNSFRDSASLPCLPEKAKSTLPPGLRTRAFIKVQDGCTNFCAYCIVPLVRGEEKSIPTDDIISQIKELTDAGYKEAVLTGTEIGVYRYNEINLKGLVRRVLSETGVTRLRLSSLQPPEITPEFVALWRNPRLCRHFHLSLQSGSDSVLSRMGRRYTVEGYRKAVSLLRSEIPDVAVTTDIIAGFPGETDKEFEESYDFCREVGFARIHVFSYSKRPGTMASKMPGQVDERVKKERSRKMLALSKESAHSFIQKFFGRTMSVLWEQPCENGLWSGLTDNYIRVYIRSGEDLTNKIMDVKLEKLYRDGALGENRN